MRGRLSPALVRVACLLLGRRSFSFDGGDFDVSPGVLNPTVFRASLTFAKEALRTAGEPPIDILELGSGTGVAAVSLARKGHRVTAVDRSLAAARNTADNAGRNSVRVRAVCSDWDRGLQPGVLFDLVITNPPFLPSPTPIFSTALWAGPNLEVVAAALQAARRRLKPAGRTLLLTSDKSGREAVLRAIDEARLQVVGGRTHRHWRETLHLDVLARVG